MAKKIIERRGNALLYDDGEIIVFSSEGQAEEVLKALEDGYILEDYTALAERDAIDIPDYLEHYEKVQFEKNWVAEIVERICEAKTFAEKAEAFDTAVEVLARLGDANLATYFGEELAKKDGRSFAELKMFRSA